MYDDYEPAAALKVEATGTVEPEAAAGRVIARRHKLATPRKMLSVGVLVFNALVTIVVLWLLLHCFALLLRVCCNNLLKCICVLHFLSV